MFIGHVHHFSFSGSSANKKRKTLPSLEYLPSKDILVESKKEQKD